MPPNQLAQVMSCTPGVLLTISACEVGMLKIIDVERIVTRRVEELAADTASKPSSTARKEENRNTASATPIIVNAVRRLLRGALLRIRPMNLMRSPVRQTSLSRGAAGERPARRRADRASP